jgi:hypothetical protein
MTLHLRSVGIGILIAIALMFFLVSGVHAAQVMTHMRAVSAAPAQAIECPSSGAHC